MTAIPSPFFAKDGAPDRGDGRRRLLLVSYHFPPSPAVGGLRWQKFSRHLSDWGYDLDVLTLSPDALAQTEPDRLEDLPPGTRVYGIPEGPARYERLEDGLQQVVRPLRRLLSGAGDSGQPGEGPDGGTAREWTLARNEVAWRPTLRSLYRGYRALLRYLRGGLWARRARSMFAALERETSYAAVISSGPPHFTHRAGRRISDASGLPLILDFRDPWSLLERLPESFASPLWLRLSRRAEARCLRSATAALLNTDLHRAAMERAYPWAGEQLRVVMNGYDREDRPLCTSDSPPSEDAPFHVMYLGNIYGSRDPRPFLRAAGALVECRSLTPGELRIEFIGDFTHHPGPSLSALAEEAGVAPHFTARGRMPRPEALARAAGASLLLNLPQEMTLCVPNKVFEYMLCDSWLLALEPEGTATERLLRSTRADVVAPTDDEGLRRVLTRRFEQWRAGMRPERVCTDPSYCRRTQARRVRSVLENQVAGQTA